MEWTYIVSIASGLISIITAGTLIRNLLLSGEKKLEERVKRVEDKTGKHEALLAALENDMKHLPDRESQHRIEINMEKMNGRLDVLNEALKPIKANAELVNDLLREQVKK